MTDLDYRRIQDYLATLVPPRPAELQVMEAYAREQNFPIIGPVAGQVCYLLTRLIGARRVFEMGSGYGYSTAWFARGVAENGGGEVHHVVWDAELSRRARAHLAALGYADLMRYHVGEAVTVLRGTAGPFDLIFNDINKEAYPASLPVIAAKLRSGGLLIVDNMLWSGRIFDETDHSPATEGVRTLTRMLVDSPDWSVMLLPVRDGLLVARKH
jgi:predicted O-methyltransferase YrrM